MTLPVIEPANLDLSYSPPVLVTVPSVELIEVGQGWETSTGVFSFDPTDLQSAIASQADPAVRTPIVKFGHTDTRFVGDGQPSFGRIENMRLTNGGMTLVGDLVGVPKWLADIMPTAYPRRSFEGWADETTATGKTWPLVVTALGLLGTEYPAITTLDDLKLLWSDVPPKMELVTDDGIAATKGNAINARRVDDVPTWKRKPEGEQLSPTDTETGRETVHAASVRRIQAQATLDDVSAAFYGEVAVGPASWWWIRQILVNPMQLVVDDDEGGLWLFDVSIDANDVVTFGDPVAVKAEYVAAAKSDGIGHKRGQIAAASYDDAETSGARTRVTIDSKEPTTAPEETSDMNLSSETLERLGLPADATAEQIEQAILGKVAVEPGEDGNPQSQPETQPTEPTAQPAAAPEPVSPTQPVEPESDPVIPDGMSLVDSDMLAEMREAIAASKADRKARNETERDTTIGEAVKAGKFPKSSMVKYSAMWDNEVRASGNADDTKQLLASMATGVIPTTERGTAGEVNPTVEETAYPDEWKRGVAATRNRTHLSARVKAGND